MTATGGEGPLSVVLLTGFLGSGKTTLIRDFLAQDDLGGTAVIVNEVGAIDVDGAVIADATAGAPISILSNGCICCSMTSDLPFAIQSVMREGADLGGRAVERIIVETSGLSRPAPIMKSLIGVPRRMNVGVVTTYDVSRPPIGESGFEEAAAQLGAAQRIVLTKTDLTSPERTARAAETVSALNPLASVLIDPDPAARAREGLGNTRPVLVEGSRRLRRRPPGRYRHARLNVFLVTFPHEVAWERFAEWTADLAGLAGERLLRVKGFIKVRGEPRPVLVQSVGTAFDPPRAMSGERADQNALVVIARDLSADEIGAIDPDLALTVDTL